MSAFIQATFHWQGTSNPQTLILKQAATIAKNSVSLLHERRNPVTHEQPGASTLAVNAVAQTSFSEIKSS